ncbi:putative FAD dependent oxidoreductase [Xylariomycetidae sp. FL0641]|nr:putative FAD dependent oxidoreductase [Xylariomycetidae sp. FL0641]
MPASAGSQPVIVVGSGLAGLSAAHAALGAGGRVHMLERAAKPGGNSLKASSGINGAGTRFQARAGGSDDSAARFRDDTQRSAGARLAAGPAGLDRRGLVEVLTARSADAVHWLADAALGVDLGVVARLGGHGAARTHRGAGTPPPGAAMVGALLRAVRGREGFALSTAADVAGLLTRGDAVAGVRYADADGRARELEGPVVVAAGGFAGDATGLLAELRPDLAGMPSTNDAQPATAHAFLAAVGAVPVDMEEVQVHPTGFLDPKDAGAGYKILAAEALRGEGGILLNGEGRRFVDEMERRDVVSEAIMKLPPRAPETSAGEEAKTDVPTRQWDVSLLLDPGACEASASHLGFYLWKGLMQKMKVKDLPPAMIEAVDSYANAVATGKDDAFGRKSFGHWRLPAGEANREEEVCIGKVTPVVHFTMGGVAFNTQAQVLKQKGESGQGLTPIAGLWAAGEITGGIHGANRLGGSSLLECVVFGRIAGTEAARSLSL